MFHVLRQCLKPCGEIANSNTGWLKAIKLLQLLVSLQFSTPRFNTYCKIRVKKKFAKYIRISYYVKFFSTLCTHDQQNKKDGNLSLLYSSIRISICLLIPITTFSYSWQSQQLFISSLIKPGMFLRGRLGWRSRHHFFMGSGISVIFLL